MWSLSGIDTEEIVRRNMDMQEVEGVGEGEERVREEEREEGQKRELKLTGGVTDG